MKRPENVPETAELRENEDGSTSWIWQDADGCNTYTVNCPNPEPILCYPWQRIPIPAKRPAMTSLAEDLDSGKRIIECSYAKPSTPGKRVGTSHYFSYGQALKTYAGNTAKLDNAIAEGGPSASEIHLSLTAPRSLWTLMGDTGLSTNTGTAFGAGSGCCCQRG